MNMKTIIVFPLSINISNKYCLLIAANPSIVIVLSYCLTTGFLVLKTKCPHAIFNETLHLISH